MEYLRLRDERWTAHWLDAIAARRDPVSRLLAIFDALETWETPERRTRGCAFLDALVEVADTEHPATHQVRAHWDALERRLRDLAQDAGVDDPGRTATDLALLYRGTLAAMMTDVSDSTIDRARALALGAIAPGGPTTDALTTPRRRN